MKKTLIILIFSFFSLIFSDEIKDTRFEKIWKKTFRKMNFRDPIIYIPYDIKIGYYSFGDSDYWKNWEKLFKVENDLSSNPFNISDELIFPDISNHVYRRGMTLELDLFKINFFNKRQNAVDILFGAGYKFNKTIKASYFENIKLKPIFHNINLNSTFVFQWDPKFYTYLYYSLGPTRAVFYTDINSEATGTGVDQGLGFGLNFVTLSQKKNNNLNYGIEIKFEKCTIDDIDEPHHNNHINSFNMSKVGILLSFGVGYGGNTTLGDKAYLNILKGDYLLALEQLNQFQHQNLYQSKISDINEMMDMCRYEISSQLYNEAMAKYFDGDLKESLRLLKESSYKANDELRFEIENKKYFIANEMLTNSSITLENYSIDEQILFFENLNNISDRISNDVNQKIADLYIKKAEIALNKQDYLFAYDMYAKSRDQKETQFHVIDIKLENMIINMLNDVYKFLQNKEYVIAYELLSLISDISNENTISQSLKDIVDKNLKNKKIKSIRNRVHKILDNEREFVVSSDSKDIYLGDHYNDVLEILGEPSYKIDKKRLDYNYEMLIFIIDDTTHRLFFKNKILIDVERES